ncbi:biopolymer transporter ExbD [Cognaticolwellia mytili]|uniref:biopolymer transporter ExbD n=1 Tax=Cognaticolwellia mytili TaxID=1888913 RepID=UPI000A170A70|nr:biopolymer transporter ExbD [Cognaticolwellia mytili]
MKLTKTVTAAPVIEPMLPLINIIFLLLIFFMVSAHIATPITGVSIPNQSKENPLAHKDNSQDKWLFVSKDGELTYQKNVMALSALADTFHDRAELSILADSEITTGALEKIAKELSKAGVKNFKLVTQLSLPTKEGE